MGGDDLARDLEADARFTFDNSSDNPFNPNRPPIRVEESWRTTDEMCLLYLTVVPRAAEDARNDRVRGHRVVFRPPE